MKQNLRGEKQNTIENQTDNFVKDEGESSERIFLRFKKKVIS